MSQCARNRSKGSRISSLNGSARRAVSFAVQVRSWPEAAPICQSFQRFRGFAGDTSLRHSLSKHLQEIPGLRRADSLKHCYPAQLAQRLAGRRFLQVFQQILNAAAAFQGGIGLERLLQLPGRPVAQLAKPGSGLIALAEFAAVQIGEQGARAIGRSKNFAHLEALDLRGNEIGDGGAEALGASADLGALRQLQLPANGLRVGGVKGLVSHLTPSGEDHGVAPREPSLANPISTQTIRIIASNRLFLLLAMAPNSPCKSISAQETTALDHHGP